MKNLSVPDVGTEIGSTPMQEVPKALGVSIETGTVAGASQMNTYHKPKPVGVSKPQEETRSPGRIIKAHGVDYRNAEETRKASAIEESEIMQYAKQIYKENADSRRRYQQAKKMVEKATEEELKSPSKRLYKAIKILERGFVDKKTATERARHTITKTKVNYG